MSEPGAFNEYAARTEGKAKAKANGASTSKVHLVQPSREPGTQFQPRQWVYGHFLLRGALSVLGALDGTGKGFYTVAIIISVITGRPLLGEKVWRTGKVAILTYEDDELEWRRRIWVACKHHELDYEFVISNIYFMTCDDRYLALARTEDGQTVFPDSADIIECLIAQNILLWIIDPWNSAHDLPDGNNNPQMAKAAREVSAISQAANAATLALHHLRKGAEGKIDDLMGAIALRATSRSTIIMCRMITGDAETLGISEHDRKGLFRTTDSKQNYAEAPDEAAWFKLVDVPVGNTDVDQVYPAGDRCAVVVLWDMPKAFEGMGYEQLRAVFARLRSEPQPGWFYSPTKSARHWAGSAIQEAGKRTEAQARTILKQWLGNNVLTVVNYQTPNRNPAKRVVLDEAKAAAILHPLAPHGEAAA